MKSRRGITLGTTLLVISLLVTLAFTMAGVLCTHLNVSNQRENRLLAQDLARSALARGIYEVETNPRYGEYDPYTSVRGPVITVAHDGGEGFLTFDRDKAQEQGLVASSNNLRFPGAAAAADGRSVPGFTARLVGEGRVGGCTQRVEAMLKIPALPALASDGKVNLSGQVLVAAVERYEDVAPLVLDHNAPRLPADLAANAKGSDCVVLGPGSLITGDVDAVGKISLSDDTCRVLGEVHTNCEPVPLPKLELSKFDPVVDGRPYTRFDWAPDPNPTFSGRLRRTGQLTVTGDMLLDSGFLYVEGDVTVEGSIKGRGAIVATGKLTVGNGAVLDANHALALMAGGDLTIQGLDRKASFIQGLVYTEGILRLDHVTVVGSTICRNPYATLQVNDANLIYLPAAEDLRIIKPMTFNIRLAPGFLGQDEPGPDLFTAKVLPMPPGTYVKKTHYGTEYTKEARFKVQYTDPATNESKEVVIAGADDYLQVLKAFRNSEQYVEAAESAIPGYQITFSDGDPQLMHGDSWSQVGKVQYMAEGGAGVLLNQVAGNWDNNAKIFELQPSKFVRWEDRLRVALWRKM